MLELKPCPFCGADVHIDHGPTYFREHLLYCEGCDMYFALDDINATEDELTRVYNRRNSEWISVEEQLPKVDEDVLVYTVFYGKRIIAVVQFDEEKRCSFGAATYWMPLPKPPEEV